RRVLFRSSCSHGKMVCEQAKVLLPEFMEVDWVGTGPQGRSQQENEEVLHRFCPPKDASGKRPWTLDVLVNVGIAGEGLDTTDVTEIVFLTPGNLTISNLQTIGRGARDASADVSCQRRYGQPNGGVRRAACDGTVRRRRRDRRGREAGEGRSRAQRGRLRAAA